MRNDDLGVGLGAEGPRLEEGLLVEDAAAVHVLASNDVVKRIGDTIDGSKEVVTENVFIY